MIICAVALLLATIPSRDSTLDKIEARIHLEPGAQVGLAYIDLGSKDTLFLNADTSFHAASTMKVPVMIELFRRASTGSFGMQQRLMLVNQFSSIVDGSSYALDSTSDSDTTLYHRIGARVPVDTLLRLMITRSSNFATNTLIALVGADQVNHTMRSLGAQRIQVRRGVEDGKAFDKGLNNTTTARDLATILRAIEEGKAGSPEATREMRELLLAQEFNEKIPAGLPAGTRVAHKTGEITAHSHDAAIVYPMGRSPYVLVVLTRGIQDGAKSSKLIADISSIVYARNSAAKNTTAGHITQE
ncbi:MAG: class A beta-lactamase-related serine hydrolase [Gemmatimonadota bacterium]|nr:class A beta-lactamase-related serine hydrolase [Gemmatimonadota bacterium]